MSSHLCLPGEKCPSFSLLVLLFPSPFQQCLRCEFHVKFCVRLILAVSLGQVRWQVCCFFPCCILVSPEGISQVVHGVCYVLSRSKACDAPFASLLPPPSLAAAQTVLLWNGVPWLSSCPSLHCLPCQHCQHCVSPLIALWASILWTVPLEIWSVWIFKWIGFGVFFQRRINGYSAFIDFHELYPLA